MNRSIVLLGLMALVAVAPAVGQVKRGIYKEVPYNNDPNTFCKKGYPPHNWMAIDGKRGLWTIINPQAPLNTQHIGTFMYVCRQGGVATEPKYGADKGGGSADPAATF